MRGRCEGPAAPRRRGQTPCAALCGEAHTARPVTKFGALLVVWCNEHLGRDARCVVLGCRGRNGRHDAVMDGTGGHARQHGERIKEMGRAQRRGAPLQDSSSPVLIGFLLTGLYQGLICIVKRTPGPGSSVPPRPRRADPRRSAPCRAAPVRASRKLIAALLPA